MKIICFGVSLKRENGDLQGYYVVDELTNLDHWLVDVANWKRTTADTLRTGRI